MNVDLLLYALTFITGVITGVTFLLFIQGATCKDYEKKE